MKLGISAIVALFALLVVLLPVRAADVPVSAQPAAIQAFYAQGHDWHWSGACRDPRYRRHHPFLCW
jgi:hypothetical protein